MQPRRAIRDDVVGASVAEYVLLLSLITLASLGAWIGLGTNLSAKTRCTADAIRAGGGGPCAVVASNSTQALTDLTGRTGGRSTQALTTGRADSRDPSGSALGGSSVGESVGDDPSRERGGDSGGRSSLLSPADAYASGLTVVATTLASQLDAVSGGDDRITEADLARAARSDDARVRVAAAILLADPAALHALDVGAGKGDVDGEISEEDLSGFTTALRERDIHELLGDTAAGEGGRDGEWSDEDLQALASDEALPASIRDWANHASANAGGGCGWNPICHVSHAASYIGDHAGPAAHWVGGLAQRLDWAFNPLPLVVPSQWDDFFEFKKNEGIGILKWGRGLVQGVGTFGKWAWDRQWDAWSDLKNGDVGGWLMIESGADLVVHPGWLWNGAKGIVGGLWHELDAMAVGPPDQAGQATGQLGMDVASVVVPGGIALKGARGAGVAVEGGERAAIEAGEVAGRADGLADDAIRVAEAEAGSSAAAPQTVGDLLFGGDAAAQAELQRALSEAMAPALQRIEEALAWREIEAELDPAAVAARAADAETRGALESELGPAFDGILREHESLAALEPGETLETLDVAMDGLLGRSELLQADVRRFQSAGYRIVRGNSLALDPYARVLTLSAYDEPIQIAQQIAVASGTLERVAYPSPADWASADSFAREYARASLRSETIGRLEQERVLRELDSDALHEQFRPSELDAIERYELDGDEGALADALVDDAARAEVERTARHTWESRAKWARDSLDWDTIVARTGSSAARSPTLRAMLSDAEAKGWVIVDDGFDVVDSYNRVIHLAPTTDAGELLREITRDSAEALSSRRGIVAEDFVDEDAFVSASVSSAMQSVAEKEVADLLVASETGSAEARAALQYMPSYLVYESAPTTANRAALVAEYADGLIGAEGEQVAAVTQEASQIWGSQRQTTGEADWNELEP